MGSSKTRALLVTSVVTLSSLATLAAGPALARTTPHASSNVTVAYVTHAQYLSANGISISGAACPAGAVPVGGGTAVADPGVEHVVQAGFAASALTRRMDGYEAMVQVRGLSRGRMVRFAVQVACVPATTLVYYAIHTLLLSANGVTWWGAPCPGGSAPVGGGTAVADPGIERVVQGGFAASALTRRMDGYEAMVQVRGLSRGRMVRFAVQVACVPATTYVIYIVHTAPLSTNGTTWWGAPCPAGTAPVGGGTAAANPLVENVAQAGFHGSAVGKFDGYQAEVQARGLPRGTQMSFDVQVACLSAAAPPTYGPPLR